MKKDITKMIDQIPQGDCCQGCNNWEWVDGVYDSCTLFSKSVYDCNKICGINQYMCLDDFPPLTEEQKQMLGKRLANFEKWEKEGTLDEHTISMEEMCDRMGVKYKNKGELEND